MSRATDLARKYKTLLTTRKIDTPLRLAHFFAQVHHESGDLIPKRESLYYTSIAGARGSFYTPFKSRSNAFVSGYLRNSVKMANYVYANRGGNGNTASGDGYRFRGGGLMQHTFKDEYKVLTARTGIDFINNPDLLKEEANAMIAAIDYWNRRGLSYYADKDDLDSVSDLINLGRITSRVGDSNGYADRKRKLATYKKEFNVK